MLVAKLQHPVGRTTRLLRQHPCIFPVWRQISIFMELGLDFATIFIVQIQTQLEIDSGLTAQLVLTLLKVVAV